MDETYGDRDRTFLEYAKTSETGLVNQGWKNSWDSVSYRDGHLGEPPIALCEVQGYADAAHRAMSYLGSRLGLHEDQEHWTQLHRLQLNFLHFWWKTNLPFTSRSMAKATCDVVASNAGHCLWSGTRARGMGQSVVERLLAGDMYTEWGIRTLSEREQRYNPMSYHNGSVRRHDTAIVGAGLLRLGRKSPEDR